MIRPVPPRPEYDYIVALVDRGSRVLDLGCGQGELLARLIREKGAQGMGVEISPENVAECVSQGLSVFQGNIDEGLRGYPDDFYDYVVLNQTLQVTRKPDYVLTEMLRVGKQAIVSFPNFAYWRVRASLGFTGRMPKSRLLPFEWYNTPNIHLLSIADFQMLARDRGWRIIRQIILGGSGTPLSRASGMFPNFCGAQALFMLTARGV